MLLKDKVVIVSGIGPGLGVKLAIEAAREGARAVAIGARTPEKLDDAEKRMREANAGRDDHELLVIRNYHIPYTGSSACGQLPSDHRLY
jgi:NAD(P)-dependent dehydrogenase (short-subunit alcohol dehydrogenase family)